MEVDVSTAWNLFYIACDVHSSSRCYTFTTMFRFDELRCGEDADEISILYFTQKISNCLWQVVWKNKNSE